MNSDKLDRLSLSAVFDRQRILDRGSSIRYLVVETSSKSSERQHAELRAPLNMAIVIDASTSMAREPMAAARQAAIGVIESLGPSDYLSIVSFAKDVQVHASGLRLDKAGRAAAVQAVKSIEHRLYTNISAGWLKGAECVARVLENEPGLQNYVLLLSDGHANHGILDPLDLQKHAEELRVRSVFTSTVGIGDHYTASLLQGLAEKGGGRMHDAQYPSEIVDVVMGELSQLRDTFVEDLSLQLRFPDGVKVENISGFPSTISSGSLLCNLGSLQANAAKSAVFRLTLPAGKSGDSLEFHANVRGRLPGSDQFCRTKDAVVSLEFVPDSRNRSQSKDEKVAMKVARVWQASVVLHAVELNRQGEIRELKRFLDQEIKYLARFVQDLPQSAGVLVGELNQLMKNAGKDWQERVRKDMQVSTYQYLTTTGDHRKIKREHWTTSFLDEE